MFLEAKVMNSDYERWELVDSNDDFNWDEVSYDGHGYVILRDERRLDVKPDLYQTEREEWNAKKNKGTQAQ
jgi:hypothetical protein